MARLTLQDLSAEHSNFEINGSRVTIGRHPDNNLVLPLPEVSAHHAEILCEEDFYTLRDLKSANGTTVNGTPVEKVELKDNDMIWFGRVKCVFSLPKPPPSPPASTPYPWESKPWIRPVLWFLILALILSCMPPSIAVGSMALVLIGIVVRKAWKDNVLIIGQLASGIPFITIVLQIPIFFVMAMPLVMIACLFHGLLAGAILQLALGLCQRADAFVAEINAHWYTRVPLGEEAAMIQSAAYCLTRCVATVVTALLAVCYAYLGFAFLKVALNLLMRIFVMKKTVKPFTLQFPRQP